MVPPPTLIDRRSDAILAPRAESQTGDALAAAIAWHEAELARLRQQQRDEAAAVLLRAIVVSVGAACFSTRELIDHARVDRELAAVLAGLSGRQIGKRLKALEGRGLVRVAKDEHGWIWQLDFHAITGVDAGAGAD